jgi:class 3 adenylate cyclase
MTHQAARRTYAILASAAWFLIILPRPVVAQGSIADPGARMLEDGWLYRAGDDAAWAAPNLDDEDWIATGVNEPWRLHGAPTGHVAWYRKRVAVASDRPLEVGLLRVYDAAELYVDGELVATDGRPGYGDPGPTVPFHGPVPADAVTDGEIVVAVRVWGGLNHLADGQISGLLVGTPDSVGYQLLARKHALWTSPVGIPQVFLGLLLAGLGLVHGLIFLRRRAPEDGLFALAMLLFGPLTTWQALQRTGMVDATWFYAHFSVLLRTSAYAALVAFGCAFIGGRQRRLATVTVVVLMGAGLFSIAHPGNPWWRAVPSAYGLAAVVGVVLIVEGVRGRHSGARLMLLGFLPLVAWGLGDTANNLVGLPAAYSIAQPWMGQVATAGVALSISAVLALRLSDNLDQLDRTYQASRRFVPGAFLHLLGRETITDVQRGDSAVLESSVMFCDIREFTGLCERRSPAEIFALINQFLAAMEPCVHDHGGTIGQYLGDGFLALFPMEESDPMGAAVAMQLALAGIQGDFLEPEERPLRIGVGVHAGEVILGTLGGRERLDANVVADAVNTASRVEGLCKRYGAPVLVSEVVLDHADSIPWTLLEIDTVIVKGRTQPLRIFELLDAEPDAELRARKAREAPAYRDALAAYRAGEFARAARGFGELESHPAARELFLRRCESASRGDLPADWDGVARWEAK